MSETPSYFAIIPAHVRYNNKLSAQEKLMYGEITALSNKYGYCTAGNDYFAKLYSTHKDTVSSWISNLKKQGYITTFVDRARGNLRKIYMRETVHLSAKMPIGIGENAEALSVKTPLAIGKNTDKLLQVNNTSIINNIISKEQHIEIDNAYMEYAKKCGIDKPTNTYYKAKNSVIKKLAEYTPEQITTAFINFIKSEKEVNLYFLPSRMPGILRPPHSSARPPSAGEDRYFVTDYELDKKYMPAKITAERTARYERLKK